MRTAKVGIAGLVTIILVAVFGYLGVRSYLSSPDRLVSQLQQQLRQGDFDSLYAESSDFMKNNTDRQEFSRRMQIMSNHIKGYDSELTLTRDLETETFLSNVTALSEAERRSDDLTISVVLLAGSVENVHIHATWRKGWLKPRLFNVSIQDFQQDRYMTLAGRPFESKTK